MAGEDAISHIRKGPDVPRLGCFVFPGKYRHGRENGATPARPFTGFSPDNLAGCLLRCRIVQRIFRRGRRTPDRDGGFSIGLRGFRSQPGRIR